MRICVISEELASPLDEGFKKFAYFLMKVLSAEHQVLGMSRNGLLEGGYRVEAVRMNKLLLNWALWRRIRHFAPEIICYLPSSSGTFNSFLRARMLKWYGSKARVVLISLQPRTHSTFKASWMRHLHPDMMCVQSAETAESLEELGCPVYVLPSGVEMEKFTPVSQTQKQRLRRRYGLPADAFLVLHVGHINVERGVRLFKELHGESGVQVLLVGSTSTSQDERLILELEKAGIRVMRDYFQHIQEVYQLSDCYLFPVTSKQAAIEIPLSVLEAMACNLPVITTRYGGLNDFFAEADGFLFAESREEVLDKISLVKKGLTSRTRAMVEAFSWENVFRTYWRRVLQ
jgi:glycosyltransferase involved in cell wall biosynthesis